MCLNMEDTVPQSCSCNFNREHSDPGGFWAWVDTGDHRWIGHSWALNSTIIDLPSVNKLALAWRLGRASKRVVEHISSNVNIWSLCRKPCKYVFKKKHYIWGRNHDISSLSTPEGLEVVSLVYYCRFPWNMTIAQPGWIPRAYISIWSSTQFIVSKHIPVLLVKPACSFVKSIIFLWSKATILFKLPFLLVKFHFPH